MAVCPTPAGKGMVSGVVETVDCNIRVLVHDTYRELVGPDTWFAAAFTGMLTIYIALLGYQLLFGRGGLRVTELPFAALKIGLILAFLTSWAAYQTLIFNFLFDGPNEIMKIMMKPLAQQGQSFNGDVMAGIEAAFGDLSGAAGLYGGMASPNANLLQGGPMLASGILWMSGITLLLVTLGLIIAAKIVLAFLLAVGPVFIGMLLFDQTRGVFEGWLRATITFALVPLAVSVFGAVMLMILAPFLDILVDNVKKNVFQMGPVITISLIVAVFTIVMTFGMLAAASIGRGFRTSRSRDEGPQLRRLPAPEPITASGSTERVEQVAARVAMMDRLQPAVAGMSGGGGQDWSRRTGDIVDAMATPLLASSDRLGQAYNRTPRPVVRRGDE